MKKNASLVILTGAGISAESGLSTFRAKNGLWETHPIAEIATVAGFQNNPDLVHRFYNQRRRDACRAVPNAAHEALVILEQQWLGNFLLVTQNVDGLHEAAGSKQLLAMHGTLHAALCSLCKKKCPWSGDMDCCSLCPLCGQAGGLRPNIVWFGEMPYYLDQIEKTLSQVDILVSIGTSGQVYPAAGFVEFAHHVGARTIHINYTEEGSALFDEKMTGLATVTVPALVQMLLA